MILYFVTLKREDPSLVNINDHLRPGNTVITKELLGNTQYSVL